LTKILQRLFGVIADSAFTAVGGNEGGLKFSLLPDRIIGLKAIELSA